MRRAMSKNLLLTTVVALAGLFLVVLGMRNPQLEPNRGPKQRPRAVVEDTVKTSDALCCKVHIDAETCSVIFVVTPHEHPSPVILTDTEEAPKITSLPVSSRAPPASVSPLS